MELEGFDETIDLGALTDVQRLQPAHTWGHTPDTTGGAAVADGPATDVMPPGPATPSPSVPGGLRVPQPSHVVSGRVVAQLERTGFVVIDATESTIEAVLANRQHGRPRRIVSRVLIVPWVIERRRTKRSAATRLLVSVASSGGASLVICDGDPAAVARARQSLQAL